MYIAVILENFSQAQEDVQQVDNCGSSYLLGIFIYFFRV